MTRPSADLVIRGGRILTVNARDEEAEAVAVVHGRIAAVGSDTDIEGLIGPGTEIIRLSGQAVVPGFIDPHNHFMLYGQWLDGVDAKWPANRRVADIVERVRARATTTPPGGWITGFGVEDSALEEKRFPTRDELDAAAPDHLVLLKHRSGHAAVANSRALAAAGITEDAADPEGGHRDRDGRGRLTGVLREKPAFEAIQALIPPPTVETLKEGVIAATASSTASASPRRRSRACGGSGPSRRSTPTTPGTGPTATSPPSSARSARSG